MGDRTWCQLEVIGHCTEETWNKVQAVIDEELCPDDSWEEGIFGISEVNYGMMPKEVHVAIVQAGLSYIWRHDSGAEYGQGFEVYDSQAEQAAAFRRDGNEITLCISEAEDPDKRAEASRWQDWIWKNGGLHVSDS